MKKLPFLVIFLSVAYLHAFEDYQLWLSSSITAEVDPQIDLSLYQEYDFRRSFDDMIIAYTKGGAYFKHHPKSRIGLELLGSWGKLGHNTWQREIAPQFFWGNDFRVGDMPAKVNITVRLRALEQARNRGGFDIYGQLDVLNSELVSLFVANKIYYNYNGFHTIDDVRPSIGLSGSINNRLSWTAFWLLYSFKNRPKWKIVNVLGFDLSASF